MVHSTFTKSALAVLAFTGFSLAALPLEKTGPCPTLTRYTPPEDWTTFPIEPSPTSTFATGTVQNPLSPDSSINCIQVPVGLKVQGIASEPRNGNPPAEPARDAGPGGANAGSYYGIPIGPIPAIPADVPEMRF